jgi:hypothetical protein
MENDEELEDYALILLILAIQEVLMPPARVPKHTSILTGDIFYGVDGDRE